MPGAWDLARLAPQQAVHVDADAAACNLPRHSCPLVASRGAHRTAGAPGEHRDGESGLQRGLGDEAVVAPYATGLAAMIDPAAAIRNFERLQKLGGRGPFGWYEALDFSPARLPEGVVRGAGARLHGASPGDDPGGYCQRLERRYVSHMLSFEFRSYRRLSCSCRNEHRAILICLRSAPTKCSRRRNCAKSWRPPHRAASPRRITSRRAPICCRTETIPSC